MNSQDAPSKFGTRATTVRQAVSTNRSPADSGIAAIQGHRGAVPEAGENLSPEAVRQLRLQQLSQILLYVIELTEEEDF